MNECAVFKAKKEKKKTQSATVFSCISEEYGCEHQEGLVEKNGLFFEAFFFVKDGSNRICRHLVKSFLFCGNADKI